MLLEITLLFIFLYQPPEYQASLIGSKPLIDFRHLSPDLDF